MDVYEKEIQYLTTQLARNNNYSSILNSKQFSNDPSSTQWYLAKELLNENEKHQALSHELKQEFLRVHTLTTEANSIANDMQLRVIYNVILQIPISYLKPNERTTSNICEVAVQVKQENSLVQIWDVKKFEDKLNIMKNVYEESIKSENPIDQFKQNKEIIHEQSESPIGVANIYLKSLFYGSKLDYTVPIINTQGQTSGSLHVVLDQTQSFSIKHLSNFQINSTTQGSMSEGISADIDEQSLSKSQSSLEDEGIDELSALSIGKNDKMIVKFSIKEARDLPKTDAKRVICRYTFINPKLDQTIISNELSHDDNDDDDNDVQKPHIFSFDHEDEYTFPITDDFLSTCSQSAVSIEVWYENKSKLQSDEIIENDSIQQHNIKVREISDRWKDVKRHLQFTVEIQELDATGQWTPVDVDAQEEILSGGIYPLKQGQSKRLITHLRVLPRANPMPLTLHAIRSVEIGSITTRKIDAPRQLDSYQDVDLQDLRCDWLDLIEKQKFAVESQVNILSQQTEKTPKDIHRERMLLEQLMNLAEEQNIAVFPPLGSGIPGAPAGWSPPVTVEMHRPLIFLNITTSNDTTAGLQALLNEENKTKMFPLPLIQNASEEIQAVALWNPAIHDLPTMNQVTPQDTLIYLIVKVTVMISEPARMELILRKRIAVTMNKTEGWWPGKKLKNLLGYKTYKRTSVVYEIVSKVPNIDESTQTDSEIFSEDSIEKHLQNASIIDSVLVLDRLRQEVLLAENSAKQQTIRKATSAPNITSKKKYISTFHSPANTRRENTDKHLSTNEPIFTLTESELNASTPSMLSRKIFLEEQQVQPIQNIILKIDRSIDLDDDKPIGDESTLEKTYCMTPSQSSKSIENENTLELTDCTTPPPVITHNNEDYSIGRRVIVNTGHQVVNKAGIIRFVGNLTGKDGTWYGIELEEKDIGKNDGSLNGCAYFQCPDKQGVFVRREKICLID